MARLGDLIVIVGANIDGFKVAMKDAIAQIDYFADEIEKKFDAIEGVGKRLTEVGAGLTAAITVPLVGLGTAALTTAAQFETTQIAFNTLSGSAEAATAQLGALYKFAAETPFEVGGVLKASRTLTAMQFAAKDVIPVLRVLGDTASGLGLGQEGLDRLVFHLGQIKALGTIDGHIIRELGQQGINAGQMLADALGKSVPEVLEMVSKKAISSTVAINALLAGMTRDFGGLMQQQSESLAGLWSNLKDNVTLSLVEIGNTLLPVAKQVVQFLLDMTAHVKELAKWFADLPSPVQAAAVAFAALAAALPVVVTGVGALLVTLPGVIALAEAMGIALGGLAVSVTVATAGFAILIPALTAFGIWIYQNTAGVKAFASALGELIETGHSKKGPFEAFASASDDARRAAEATNAVNKALQDLRLNGAQAFAGLSDPAANWAEQHAQRVKTATEAVATLEAAEKRGAVTADQLAAAHKRLNAVLAEKMPDFTDRGPKDSSKLSDQARAKAREIDGEVAHTKALLKIEQDRIDFRLRTKQIGEDEALALTTALEKKELDAEKDALERKKVIYRNDLTEKQSIDNQMVALADRTTLALQQASEKAQEATGRSLDNYLKSIQKSFSETTKELAVEEGRLLNTAREVAAEMARLSRISEQGKNETAQHDIAMRRLELEREYGEQVGHTAAVEIAYQQQILRLDRESFDQRIKLLQAERDGEADAARRAQLDNEIAAAKNQQQEREYGQLTRIRDLQRQNTVQGQLQAGIWNTVTGAFEHLSQSISSAIVQARSLGQAFKEIARGIAQDILQTIISAALLPLKNAIEAALFKIPLLKAASAAAQTAQIASIAAVTAAASASDVSQALGLAAVGGAAAAASTAAIPIIGPLLAPEAGLAMYSFIAGLFGPLAAFEKGGLVPETMLALVHKGEWVTPAAQVAQGITGPRSGGGNQTNHITIVNNNPREVLRQLTRHLKLAGGPVMSPAATS